PTFGRTVTFVTTRGDFDGSLGAPLVKTTTAIDNGDGTYTVSLVSDGSDGAGESLLTATEATSGASTTETVVFVSTSPSAIDLQASPATIPVSGSSTLTAIVRDANNNLVADQVVDFTLTDSTGGNLSSASGITNSQGAVTVTYNASTTPSATNGVLVTATVDGTAISDSATLTVGGQAVFIALGTGNKISAPTTTTYAMPFSAVVTDAAGNPAPAGTVFRLAVISVAYQKGAFITCGPPWVPTYTIPAPSLRSSFGQGCPSEDVNTNGILDPGEDANSNNTLEPGNVVTVPSTVNLVDGVATFNLTYPSDRAYWVEVTLKATASVAGSESVETTTFVLPGLADDYSKCEVAPPGQISPYGTG